MNKITTTLGAAALALSLAACATPVDADEPTPRVTITERAPAPEPTITEADLLPTTFPPVFHSMDQSMQAFACDNRDLAAQVIWEGYVEDGTTDGTVTVGMMRDQLDAVC